MAQAAPPEARDHRVPELVVDACASACVSTYSRIFATFPSRTVMANTQWSSNVLFVALILPVAKPTTRTRSPCATYSGGSGNDVSTVSEAFRRKSRNPACPRCVPASGQSSPGTIHSISSAASASRPCLSPLPMAAKKSFTTWTFACALIGISPSSLRRFVAAQFDLQGDVEAAGAVLSQADEHQAERFERRRHVQAADIERTQTETLDEGRDAGLGIRIVGGDERVEASTLSEDGAEEGVERLHDMRAGRRALGDLLRPRTACGGDEAFGVFGHRVGDVDDDFAVERIPVLGDHRCRTAVRHGEDDDVALWRGAVGPRGRWGCEPVGQRPRLGGVAADHLNGVSGLGGAATDRCGHAA